MWLSIACGYFLYLHKKNKCKQKYPHNYKKGTGIVILKKKIKKLYRITPFNKLLIHNTDI